MSRTIKQKPLFFSLPFQLGVIFVVFIIIAIINLLAIKEVRRLNQQEEVNTNEVKY